MNSFDTKYKDRSPNETIFFIEDFFQQKGYELSYQFFENKEYSIFSCQVNLILKKQIILSSNGKGLNKEYCLASGLGELYERFCNKFYIYNNFWVTKYYQEKNLLQNNYFFHKDEKILDFSKVKESPVLNELLNIYFNDEQQQKDFINLICDNQIIGLPFNGFNINEIKYFDPRILIRFITTTGMSCGNTLEEALNQGISEILERYSADMFYLNPNEKYHIIDISLIENNNLKNILNKLERYFNVYVLDLAYTFKVPTVALVLIDKNNYNISINFGTFPDFDIALERCITEIFQGNKIYNKISEKQQFSYSEEQWFDYALFNGHNTKDWNCFPEQVLFNLIKEQKESSLYCKNLSNSEINKYYQFLSSKLDIKFYYCNTSLSDNLKSIFIFSDNVYPIQAHFIQGMILSSEDKNIAFNFLNNYFNLVKNIFTDNKNKYLINLFSTTDYIIKNKYLYRYIITLLCGDQLIPYNNLYNFTLTTFYFIWNQDLDKLINVKNNNTFYNKIINKILFIFNNFYNEKLLNIFDIKEEEILNKNNIFYILDNYFISYFYNELNSNRFFKYIESIVSNKKF